MKKTFITLCFALISLFILAQPNFKLSPPPVSNSDGSVTYPNMIVNDWLGNRIDMGTSVSLQMPY